jgi:type I restriction enzyme M protein
MNKQQLASTIWQSANQMRSKIEANEYKDYILGFMFYKYISEREVHFLKNEGYTEADIKKVNEKDKKLAKHIRQNIGYFISYENLFSTWLEKCDDFNIANVRDALNSFDLNIEKTYKKIFENIFKTLQTGLSKLGDTAQKQTKSVKSLLKLIKRIPMNGKQDYDILGFIYEYLISMFAANAGKKAGEFYTPHEVSVLMSEIIAEHLKNKDHIKIYDPTSGSGSLLINIGTSIGRFIPGENKVDYYAQELKENTYNLTRMNLVMRGINPSNINVRNGDTLEDDWPFFENDQNRDQTYHLVKVDAVVSNPPYSQKWDPKDKEYDPRYKEFGVAPKAKADYAFLLHDLYHLEDDGIMTIVLPHGVLFRGGEEGKIRETLIERNHIEAIIGLPANIFFGTSIPTIVLVLRKTRKNSDVLIIDASKGFEKAGKSNKLRACDIKKIADTVRIRKPVEKYAAIVPKDKIRENEYNLNIPRYINSSDDPEKWDIRATMFGGIPIHEAALLQEYWDTFPGLFEKLFKETSDGYLMIPYDDIRDAVLNVPSLQNYKSSFTTCFADFYEYLHDSLIENILDVNAQNQKEEVCSEIFNRISKIKLLDKYKAYQILSENWKVIESDLEMIQTDGFEAIFKVDPNMVIKKKSDEDDEVPEVQEGWKGRILPFELVQQKLHSDELEKIIELENRLKEIASIYTEVLESLEDDELENSTVNDDKNAFVAKEVKIFVAEALKDVESPEISGLQKYLTLSKKKDKLEYISKTDSVAWNMITANKDGTYGKAAIHGRIVQLQLEYSFPENSFEEKMKQILLLMDEETQDKRELKVKKDMLHLETKKTIESMNEDTALKLLDLKWITPFVDGIFQLPEDMITKMISKIVYLNNKYTTTFADIEENRIEVSKKLYGMLGDLKGSTSDMEGLNEFRKSLEVKDE